MRSLDLLLAGDLVLDEPDPDYWLSGIAPAVRSAELAIAHVEVPHTRVVREHGNDIPAPGADPAHVPAIARAGFHMVSLAGNHITDCGAEGIADTVASLRMAGVACTGADLNLTAARRPAIVERAGGRVALLSYNCVGPESSWASDSSAGCAYVRIETADGAPIAPAAKLERIDPDSLASMQQDIADARANADIVIVSLHKGIVHTRARLAPYERALTHAAVDAGCDIVMGHHAHIVRVIERYRGKPVFHGLGNACVVTRALSPDQNHPARAEWARKRREMFGFEPDPAYHLAPFHPDAINAMMGRVRIHADGRIEVGFVPVHVEAPGRPVLATGDQRQRVADYIRTITAEAGLPAINLHLENGCAWLT